MSHYRTLLKYAMPYRRSFALIVLLSLGSAIVLAFQPWPLKWLVDHVLSGNPVPGGLDSIWAALSPARSMMLLAVILVTAGLMVFVLQSGMNAGLDWIWIKAGRRMVYDLAEDLFAGLQRQSILFHRQHEVGDLMGRLSTDSWCIHHLLDTLFVSPLRAFLAVVAMLLFMLQLDPWLTLFCVVIAPLMVGASFLVGKPLQEAAMLRREMESRLQSQVQQALVGIPVVQAFVQEEREQRQFHILSQAAIRAQQKSTLIGSVNSLGSGFVFTLGTGAVLWMGAQHVMAGTLTVGGLLAFLAWLSSLQLQLKVFTKAYTALQEIRASVKRILEIVEEPSPIQEPAQARTLPPIQGHLVLQDVTFGYEPDQPVLKKVSLEIFPQETLALIGSTGAGKTTLSHLLPRLFDPWEGHVTVDGHDIRQVTLRSLRDQVGLVLQEPFLLPMSIADNIAYGRPTASRLDIMEAARTAHAHAFIEKLPQGYDTLLGTRGVTLSGGERQRLSLARALLKNPPLLILDEPTSAVDSETEQLILQGMNNLMKDRTTLLIAHRLSTVRHADRIAVMKDGKIAECGSHEDLIRLNGVYAGMVRRSGEGDSKVDDALEEGPAS